MQFDEALRYLLSLGHETLAIKLGLRNITLLLERLRNPQLNYFVVQLAGTNGKGSTARMLESICRAAGLRVGLFTSPHLVSITERILINGNEIAPDAFAEYATRVRLASEALVAESQIEAVPSFFEQVTALALLAFQSAAVELAILETGLGGRLDATTAAGAKLVGITPIAMDHEEYLGATITEVAKEKAAIIQSHVTAIIAPQDPEALRVIVSRAQDSGVVPSVNEVETSIESFSTTGHSKVNFQTKYDSYPNVHLGLRGRHQIINASMAVRLAEALRNYGFEVPKEAVVRGLETATHPGRLELFEGNPNILLDGAHNPSGAQALRNYLDEFVRGPITLVFGAMRDKQLDAMARILFPVAENLVLTEVDNPRSASSNTLQLLAGSIAVSAPVFATSSISDAIHRSRVVTPTHGLICIAGSLYLIGEYLSLAAREAMTHGC
jgi:dihydrofolate synthase/folylpolyglutamate synthase